MVDRTACSVVNSQTIDTLPHIALDVKQVLGSEHLMTKWSQIMTNHPEILLDETQARVVGCLIEKEMATPDYYPLSLNALVNACNQKTNRYPVVSYSEETVRQALDELKSMRLVWQSDATRVPKFGHTVDKVFTFVHAETALICLLLLRGPQTVGELRGRSERLHPFATLEETAETLDQLTDKGLVRQLPRQPGHKEVRFCHLLGGEPPESLQQPSPPASPPGTAQEELERITALEEEVAALRADLEELRRDLHTFRKEFE